MIPRFRFTLILLCLLGMISNYAQTGLALQETNACDEINADFISRWEIPGASIAIAKGGKLFYTRGFGQVDQNTAELTQPYHRFRLAGLSKTVTAVAILKLVEEGQLQLSDKVFGDDGILASGVYSDLTITDDRIFDITVQQLLEHSAGWSIDPVANPIEAAAELGGNNPASTEILIGYALERGLSFDPGTNFKYADIGYVILGEIIAEISGSSYETYVQKELFAPADICDITTARSLLADRQERETQYNTTATGPSAFDPSSTVAAAYGQYHLEATTAANGWVASSEDFLKFLLTIDGLPSVADVLSAQSINTLTTPSANNSNYAKGVQVDTDDNWWHSGLIPGSGATWGKTDDGYLWVAAFNKDTLLTEEVSSTFATDFNELLISCINLLDNNFSPVVDFRNRPDNPATELEALVTRETDMLLTWSPGNGDQRLIVYKEGAPVDRFPLDGQTYTAGDSLGNGNVVALVTNGFIANLQGLNPDTDYYFRLIEFATETVDGEEEELYQVGCSVSMLVRTLPLSGNDCKCTSNRAENICEDFESFNAASSISLQSNCWTTFIGQEGGFADANISTAQAFDGNSSLLINGTGAQDVLFTFADRMEGIVEVRFRMYIPSDRKGFYNIQNSQADNDVNLSVEFGNVGPGQGSVPQAKETFSYPEDEWFLVSQVIDLNGNTLDLTINDQALLNDFPYDGNLGALNFYSQATQSEFYVDQLNVQTIESANTETGSSNLVCDDQGNLTVNGTVVLVSDLVIKNNGEATAAGSSVGFFLSENTSFTTTDFYIGENFVKGLEPEESVKITFGTDFSQLDIPAGEYFVGYILDYKNIVEELDEEDNNDCFFLDPKVTIAAPPKPDLAIDTVGTLVVENGEVSIEGLKIVNQDDADAGASKLAFFLSQNDNVTPFDFELASQDLPAIPAGDTVEISLTAGLESVNLVDGDYTLGVIVDVEEIIDESDEDNNTGVYLSPLVTLPVGDPNLTCSDAGTLTFEDEMVDVEDLQITNDGVKDAGAFTIGVYLSESQNFTTYDYKIGEIAVDTLPQNAILTLDFAADISNLGIPEGTYYLGFKIDDDDEITEENETDNNNCFFNTPAVKIPAKGDPNLVCNNTGWAGITGSLLELTMIEILNTGNGPAAPSHLGFYLSTNRTISRLDYFIGYAPVPALARDSSTMVAFSVDLDTVDIPAGQYLVGYIIDEKEEVKEILEIDNSNCFFTKPDIIIDAAKANLVCKDLGAFSFVGDVITVDNFVFTNDGEGAAEGSRVGFYVSTDDEVNSDDIFVGELFVNSLAPGAVASVDFSKDISDLNLPPGNYFFGYVLDNQNDVKETNEADNTCAFQTQKLEIPVDGEPNLACEDKGTLIIEDEILQIKGAKVVNTGNVKAGSSVTGIYFSTNDMITTYDHLVEEVAVPELNPGEVFTFDVTIDLNSVDKNKVGDFFVGFYFDYKNEVDESNESDNNDCVFEAPKVSLPLEKEPNLVCTDPGYLDIKGLQVTIASLEVTNTGNEASVPTSIGFYASTDENFTTADSLIGTLDIGAVQPGQTLELGFQTDIDPNRFPDGTYMIGFIIDYEDKVKEQFELDNKCGFKHPTLTFPVPGKADLVCKDNGTLTISGHTIDIKDLRVFNTGDGTAAASYVGIYLSKDKNFTKSDILVAKVYVQQLHPGYGIKVNFHGSFGDLAECGDYYVGVILDVDDDVHEVYENNNVCHYDYPQVHKACPKKADLTCKDVGKLTIDEWDVNIQGLQVQNIGETASTAGFVCVYLSTNQTITGADQLLAKLSLPALNPGQVANLSTSFDLEALGVNVGNYYIGFIIDCDNTIHEESDGNNTCFYNQVLELKEDKKPDLQCYSLGTLTIDDWDIFIRKLQVANLGKAASEDGYVCIYLSTDANITTSDVLVKKIYLPALNPNYYAELSANIELMDLNVPYGSYHVGVIIDCDNTIHESNESNNTCKYDQTLELEDPSKPDLTCKSLGTMTCDDWDVYIAGAQVQNIGDAPSDDTEVCVYLSKDQNFGSTSDILVGTIPLSAISAGGVATLPNTNFELMDLNIPYGSYFIGLVIDCEDKIHESNEYNNTCGYTKKLELEDPSKPDLACKDIGTVFCDDWDIFLRDAKIRNIGDAPSDDTEVCVYLSTDQNFGSSSDYLIRTIYLPALNPGEVATLANATIDLMKLNVPPGQYYVGYVIDCNDKVHESDEYNNVCSLNKLIELKDPAKPDLQCYDRGTVTCDDWDLFIRDLKVANLGDKASGAAKVCIYLSQDQKLSNSDILVKKLNLLALNPNYYQELSANIELMNLNVPYGNYYVIVSIDCEDDVHESAENNNSCTYDKVLELKDPRKPDLTCKDLGKMIYDDWDIYLSDIKVQNVGDKASDATEVCVYLSTDKNFGSASDYLIRTIYLPGLSAGATAELSNATIDLMDLNVPYGNYYVGLVIDCNDKVHESDEYNNICHYDNILELKDPRKPDLTCKSTGTIRIDDWDIFLSGIQIRNIGDKASGTTEVCIYLSKDENFGSSSDFLVETVYLPGIAAGSSTTLPNINIELMDLGVPYGEYFVGLVIDCNDKVHESNESNNICSYTKKLELEDPRKPDLTCMDLGTLTIDDWDIFIRNLKITNMGDKSSEQTFVCVYLSNDKNFTNSDFQVSKIALPGLQPDESAFLSANIELMDLNVPYGDYYVGIIIDCDGYIHESGEGNNICHYDDILHLPDPRKPDLECKDLGYYTIDKDWKLEIKNLKVGNHGDAASGKTKVSVYLSENTTITTNDIFLGDIDLQALNAGDFAWLNFTSHLKGKNIPYGHYYVGIIIDRHNAVEEHDENNNTCYYGDKLDLPEPGKPDLTCKDLGELICEEDGDIKINNLKVVNLGETKSNAARVGVYISANNTITKNDIFLGSINLEMLEPNQTAWLSFTGNINSLNLDYGSYFVGIIIDDQNHVHEEDENNNTCFYTKKLELEEPTHPDLTCKSTGTIHVDDWDIFLSGITVQNIGDAPSDDADVCIYLSKDKNFGSGSDHLIKTVHLPGINAGAHKTLPDLNIELMSLNVPYGNYYVGIVIDCKDEVKESNEHNNVCHYDKIVELKDPSKPDLTCKDVGHISIDDWDIFLSGIKVQNIGDKASESSYVCVYLSKDKNFGSGGDHLVKKLYLPGLHAGAHTTLSSVNIELMDLNVPYGDYFVGLVIDCDNKVHESNEHNNVCHYDDKLELKDPKPDLTCKSVGHITIDDWDIRLSNIQIENIGNASSDYTYVCVYLSKDKNFGSSSDYLVKKIYLKGLSAGASTTLSTANIELMDLNVPYGNYFVGLVIDCDDKVHESNEHNNVCHYNEELDLEDPRKPDLSCRSVGSYSGDEWDIILRDIQIQNTGDKESAPTKVCVYLSKDKNFGSSSDIKVKEIYLTSLDPKQWTELPTTSIELMNFHIPYGDYYVGLVIDCDDKVHESDEYNNTCHYSKKLELSDPAKADLTCHSTGSLTVNDQNIILKNVQVKNAGDAKSGSFDVCVYLSKDKNFGNGNDILIGEKRLMALNSGQVINSGTINIDLTGQNIPKGDYYLGIVIDCGNEEHESNEHNNICHYDEKVPIGGTKGTPDLVCKSAGDADYEEDDAELEIENAKVRNQGNAQAAASKLGVYLSTDIYYDNNDLLIGEINVNALNQNASTGNLSGTFDVSGVSSGTYYVVLLNDYKNEVVELDENNNACHISGKIEIENESDLDGCNCADPYDTDICENFDAYLAANYVSTQSDCWTTMKKETEDEYWEEEDAKVMMTDEDYKHSLVIDEEGQNVMMMMGERSSGIQILKMDMFIEPGEMAAFSIMEEMDEEKAFFTMEFGTSRRGEATLSGTRREFDYPEGEWFTITMYYNLSLGIITYTEIGDESPYIFPIPFKGDLGALQFKAETEDYKFRVDNISLQKYVNPNTRNADDDLTRNQPGVTTGNNQASGLNTPPASTGTETELSFGEQYSVYPNPTNGSFTLDISLETTENIEVMIINTMGQVIRRYNFDGTNRVQQTIDLSTEPVGLYLIRSQAGDKIYDSRLLLQK